MSTARGTVPRYLAPIPRVIEEFALRYAWGIVAINLLGTLFGLWFYGVRPFSTPVIQAQLATEPLVVWPFVPQSPTATFFMAASLALWKLERNTEWVNAVAFFGCIKLGLWTPFVLVVFRDGFGYLHPAMYQFLVWSHVAMAVQAFLIYRYSEFEVRAILVAVVWYGVSDVLGYFIPVVGNPHHPSLPVARDLVMWGGATALHLSAAAAVLLTLTATVLAFLTRIHKLRFP